MEMEFARHCCLVAYNFWSKLEREGGLKVDHIEYYTSIGESVLDPSMCPICEVARKEKAKRKTAKVCNYCPIESWSLEEENVKDCGDEASYYDMWDDCDNYSKEQKVMAGNIVRVIQKWGEELGVFAKRD